MVRWLLSWAAVVSAAWAVLPSTARSVGPVTRSASPVAHAAARPASNGKRACVYAGASIAALTPFAKLVGRNVDCALVFNGSAPDWATWEKPWFVNYKSQPDLNWSAWTAANPSRLLVISQNLFPANVSQTDWLHAGASGAYAVHARTLAQNLVAAGLGSSVIRIAWEANGDWYDYSVGHTKTQAKLWVQFWRRTALAMKSVPGANFSFDWCVNSEVTRLPLSRFYPGDDVVNIVGIDAYDVNVPKGQNRWKTVYGRHMGIRQVLQFAKSHHKPLSLPEWGLGPRVLPRGGKGGGDDPGYINGVASVVKKNKVAYEAYFYEYQFAQQLAKSKKSLKAYRHHFGAKGDAVRSQVLR